MGKDRRCRPTSDIPGSMACEVPAMRSKANEVVISNFIGTNVAPKILLTSRNSFLLEQKSMICPENTGRVTLVLVFIQSCSLSAARGVAEPICSPKDKNENDARQERARSPSALKSGAANSFQDGALGRAETRRRYALARPCSASPTPETWPRRRPCEVGFSH